MDCFCQGILMAKIIAFGDSFFLGNELKKADGSCTWPGLIAQRLNCDFDIRASAGCGNDYIAHQIFDYFDPNKSYKDILVVINWTWNMRWDFHIKKINKWIGLGPTCVPEKLKGFVDDIEANRLIDFYQRYFEESDTWNKLRSLKSIFSSQKFLESLGVSSIQTFMDRELWYPNFPLLEHYKYYKDPLWPDINKEEDIANLDITIQKEIKNSYLTIEPKYIDTLRKLTKNQLTTFDGHTFLEWCQNKNFKITSRLHPLQEAHDAAADFWQPVYQKILSL